MIKPSIPKGTRDFGTAQSLKRDYLFQVITAEFKKHGFNKIETPAMENLSTLTGKYGEEGDQLVFKILNNGDFLSKVDSEALSNRDSKKALPQLSKRGLRYDLTVPFARFVSMHQNDITFPFKRYQVQPVWRADRPQKGRYQEFYQCDADVVGSGSLLYEAEFLRIFDAVFTSFGLPVKILINNRKILAGIIETVGLSDHFVEVITIIDKWDKIGSDKVKQELIGRSLSEASVTKLMQLMSTKSVDDLSKEIQSSEIGQKGIEELKEVLRFNENYHSTNSVQFTPTLARGLDYYTGCIYEVKALDAEMGSIASGGRYDNLTEVFGLKGISGVGISFGAERIYDLLEEKSLFPSQTSQTLDLLAIALDEDSLRYTFDQISKIRNQSKYVIDIYPEVVKMKKSMKYADQRNVPFVAIIGEEERNNNRVTLKNMETGDQLQVPIHDITTYLDEHSV